MFTWTLLGAIATKADYTSAGSLHAWREALKRRNPGADKPKRHGSGSNAQGTVREPYQTLDPGATEIQFLSLKKLLPL
jgi:hypothetical protein